MNRFQSTIGLVINRQLRGDKDQVITILTPQLGKIQTISKNILHPKSHRSSALQLGNLVKVQLYQKNNRYWLSEAISITSFLANHKNLSQLNLLFYFLELLNRFVKDNQHIDTLFDVSTSAVAAIGQNQFKKFIQQEIFLLQILGFGVPTQIHHTFQLQQLGPCQKQLHHYFESILEQPLESPKLFR